MFLALIVVYVKDSAWWLLAFPNAISVGAAMLNECSKICTIPLSVYRYELLTLRLIIETPVYVVITNHII